MDELHGKMIIYTFVSFFINCKTSVLVRVISSLRLSHIFTKCVPWQLCNPLNFHSLF